MNSRQHRRNDDQPADGSVATLSPENDEAALTNGTNIILPVNSQQELPFLVTHWLENYGTDADDSTSFKCPDDERQQAVARIRLATAEIASAFASLGAYGMSFQVSIRVMLFLRASTSRAVLNLPLVLLY